MNEEHVRESTALKIWAHGYMYVLVSQGVPTAIAGETVFALLRNPMFRLDLIDQFRTDLGVPL